MGAKVSIQTITLICKLLDLKTFHFNHEFGK